MTEEIFGAVWQDDVIALAVENSDITLNQSGTATLVVRAVFGGSIASQRKENSNFTFAVETAPAATATDLEVGANDGVITAGSVNGAAVISVTLTDYDNVPPAYAYVTVTGG